MKVAKKNAFTIMGILFFMTLLASKCDKPPLAEVFYDITIINNSGDSVCALFFDKHSTTQYPDTVLPIERPVLFLIAPSGKYYHYSRVPWSKEFEYLVADTLSIFVLNAKLYQDSSWSYIRDNYHILKRYDLSYENLESLDFNVPYPPTAEMAGMKMFP